MLALRGLEEQIGLVAVQVRKATQAQAQLVAARVALLDAMGLPASNLYRWETARGDRLLPVALTGEEVQALLAAQQAQHETPTADGESAPAN